MSVDAPSAWEALLAEVPRAPFIPDTIWIDDDSGAGLVALSQHTDPDRWQAAVSANAPVVTQVNLGDVAPGQQGRFPSSSCSQPSIVADMLNALDVQPGQSVLEIGTGTGRFRGDLAFMRIRSQRRALYRWRPKDSDIERAQVSTTECRGSDLDRMLNPDKGTFAIGARLASCCLIVEWDKHGELHHNLELDDAATRSWAQLDANLTDPASFTVRQLGPRTLWDEAEAAYDWWHDQGEPRLDRFGFDSRDKRQWVWLDEPDNVVRVLR